MCPHCQNPRKCIIKRGFYPRKTGQKKIQRFYCRDCERFFSAQTNKLSYRERKAHLNQSVARLLAMGLSQRETAYALSLQPRTVANKLVRLSRRAKARNIEKLIERGQPKTIVFDEMETFEHTKCKPLSIVIGVEEGSRRLLACRVAQMPAKGRLAAISRKRYGPRKDKRPRELRRALMVFKVVGANNFELKSDESPRYPKYVKEVLPGIKHTRFKGRRGCVVGQGELKATGFDPLFSLNHTCAMARDKIKRLSRRTWCTTKRPDRLQCLMELFMYFHNERLIKPKELVVL